MEPSTAEEIRAETANADNKQLFEMKKEFKSSLALLHGHGQDLKRQYTALNQQLAAQEKLVHHIHWLKQSMDIINANYGITEDYSDESYKPLNFLMQEYDIPESFLADHESISDQLHGLLTAPYRDPRTETQHFPTMMLDPGFQFWGHPGNSLLWLYADAEKHTAKSRFVNHTKHVLAAGWVAQTIARGDEMVDTFERYRDHMYDCGIVACPITRYLKDLEDAANKDGGDDFAILSDPEDEQPDTVTSTAEVANGLEITSVDDSEQDGPGIGREAERKDKKTAAVVAVKEIIPELDAKLGNLDGKGSLQRD